VSQKYNAEPRTKIPSTIRPAKARTPGTVPGWLIAIAAIAPGAAFIGGIIAGRWGL
jgi:hypothetical protein